MNRYHVNKTFSAIPIISHKKRMEYPNNRFDYNEYRYQLLKCFRNHLAVLLNRGGMFQSDCKHYQPLEVDLGVLHKCTLKSESLKISFY